MLGKHLEWDHKGYIAEWQATSDIVCRILSSLFVSDYLLLLHQSSPLQLLITIPDVDESEPSEDEEPEQDFLSDGVEDDEGESDSVSGFGRLLRSHGC